MALGQYCATECMCPPSFVFGPAKPKESAVTLTPSGHYGGSGDRAWDVPSNALGVSQYSRHLQDSGAPAGELCTFTLKETAEGADSLQSVSASCSGHARYNHCLDKTATLYGDLDFLSQQRWLVECMNEPLTP